MGGTVALGLFAVPLFSIRQAAVEKTNVGLHPGYSFYSEVRVEPSPQSLFSVFTMELVWAKPPPRARVGERAG